jgi:hypothetical protein
MVIADWSDNIAGILFITFLFGGGIIVTVVTAIANNWRKVHQSEHLSALKQSMVERGMSAEEIERVLNAGPSPGEADASEDASQLATKLAEHGVPGPEMEQILTAYCNADAGTKKTLSQTVVAMVDGGAKSEQLLAAARAFTRTPPPEQPPEHRFTDDAASFRR